MKDNNSKFEWVTSDTFMPVEHPYVRATESKEEKGSQDHLVYGLKGLADFLHQSVTTAWRLKKSGKFDSAICQRGRCIITDTEKLLELMRLDNLSSSGQSGYSLYVNSFAL